jgi:membrane-associated phospholipid phosphatase
LDVPSCDSTARLEGATTYRGTRAQDAAYRRRVGPMALGAALSGLAYVGLSYVVRVPRPLAGDLRLARWVQDVRWPPLAWLLWWVSALGFPPALPAIPVAAATWLWLAKHRLEALCVLASSAAGATAVMLKLVATRPRPDASLVRVHSTLKDYSFPSGHVATYTGLCGFLAYLSHVDGVTWKERRLVPAICGLVIGLMGPSRVYRGHHWASDVLGGYILGFGQLLLVLGSYRRLRRIREDKLRDRPCRPCT